MDEFFRVQNQSVSENCLRQLKQKLIVEFVVENVYRKKFINKHEKLNKQLYNVNEAFARNPNPIQREIVVETFFVTDATETYNINISNVTGLIGEFQFLSHQDRKISLKFLDSVQLIHFTEKPFRLVTRPIKLKMDAMSSRRVNFNYYTYDNYRYYEIQFEMSNTSTIRFPYSLQEPCPSEQSPQHSLNVYSFFDEHANFVKSLDNKNDQQINLAHVNGKYILKGFPLIEKLSSAEVKTVVSDKDDL